VKVAIVEDEVILAMALTLMLEDWGHQVVGTADSEAGAMVLVKDERPDVVVMDIRLGRRDSGLHAARLIRTSSDVPIVFCTATISAPIQAQVASVGNAHLIGKPVDEDQLEWLLRTINDRQRKIVGAPSLVSAGALQPASNDL